MRICVIGDCESARVLRGYIEHPRIGFVNSDVLHDYQITITEKIDSPEIVIDGNGSELEQAAQSCIAEMTDSRILLHRQGGVQNERELAVTVPANPKDRQAVEHGLLRALLNVSRHGAPTAPEPAGGDEVTAALGTPAPAAVEVMAPSAVKYLITILQLIERVVADNERHTTDLAGKVEAAVDRAAQSSAEAVAEAVTKAASVSAEATHAAVEGINVQINGLGPLLQRIDAERAEREQTIRRDYDEKCAEDVARVTALTQAVVRQTWVVGAAGLLGIGTVIVLHFVR